MQRYIDHTLLKAEASADQIRQLCSEAVEHDFFSVCINPTYVKLAAHILQGTSVKVCTVIGFPLGANTTEVKAYETKNAIENGANEIDMVMAIGMLKSKDYEYVRNDIAAVVQAADGKIVKVIIETSLLNQDEKIMACQLCLEAQAHFVKTSTGFSGGGATIDDVQLMKNIVGDKALIKASGGIKDLEFAKALIVAGASRLGTSSGISLLKGTVSQGGY